MSELIFFSLHVAAIGLLALAGYAFGSRLTRGFAYHSTLERVAFSVTLGLGVIAYAVFLLGLVSMLRAPVLVALLVIGMAACGRELAGLFKGAAAFWKKRGEAQPARLKPILVSACIVALMTPPFLLALYPPTAWDATEYHLASAKIYSEQHGIVFTPYLRFPVFPQTVQMLFTLALTLYDDVFAQLIQFLMMTVLAVALFAFSRRFFSERAAWWAAAAMLGSPLVVALGTIAYIDMGLMLFTTMSLYAVSVWSESRQTRWLILGAVFCGLAIGTKYPGLFVAFLLSAYIAFSITRERKFKLPLLFAALSLLIAVPWFMRSFYYMRNPVFPFLHEQFGNMFGYGEWKPEDFRGLFDDYSRYGVGRSIKSFFMLPYNILVHWKRFGGGIVSPIYFIVPHILFIFGVARKKIAGLLAFGFAFTLFWFLTAQESRYIMPALPALALAMAAAVDSFFSRIKLPFLRRLLSRELVTILGVILLVLPGWAWCILRMRERGPVPVNKQQRDDYLSRWHPSYPAFKFLNEMKGGDYRLYALGMENMAYFCNGVFKGDHFGPARYSRIQDKLTDAEALHRELQEIGADYLLIKSDSAGGEYLQGAGGQKYFKLIYYSLDALLFQIN